MIGLLPVSLLGIWGIWAAIETQKRELERSTVELSRALGSAVEAELNATLEALAAMAKTRSLVEGDVPAFFAQVRTEVGVRSDWAGVVLTDGRGNLLFKSSLPYGGKDGRVIDVPSLERAILSRQPVVGSLAAGQVHSAAFPVRWPVIINGQLAYVLTAAVKPDRIVKLLEKQRVPAKWVISVFDGAGRRVARSSNHLNMLGGRPAPSLALLLSTGRDSGSGITTTLEGEETFSGFTRLPGSEWTVAVGAPTQDTTTALTKSLAWYLAGLVASVIVCLALARRVANRIATDIGAVRDSAVELGEGRPVVAGGSEIEEVDQMALALRAASERLGETTESQREALRTATAAAQAKDEFLAMLGHELRNPLAPMVTVLHLLELKSDSSTLRERQIMRRQVEHMRRLVDDLLDISRFSRGKLEMRSEPVNLATVIERSVEAVHTAAQEAGQRFVVQLPPAPVWVDGDETRLVQAVTNLITNALHHGGTGEVSVSVGVEVGLARVAVRDEGVGMTPETVASVFEPFYQARQSLERSAGGMGLGLAIVKTVIELHRGTVTASSEGPGKGSTFEFALPVVSAPADAVASFVDPLPERSGRVLVVDDNADSLETILKVLEIGGHQVRGAVHPRDALAIIAEFLPDVAIFDIGLPDMDGYQLARAARTQAPDWRGHLIALTGYGQASDKAKGAEAGFAVHLTKPAEPAVLLSTVERLLEGTKH